MVTRKEFMRIWMCFGTDPDGENMPQIALGGGKEDSYNLYSRKKIAELEQNGNARRRATCGY
jgi:hypothetical protein